jgi:pantetheine-phosphate adenylyltransferase
VGHEDVIRRGAALFDTLVVAVGQNPAKRYTLDVATRVSLVEMVCADVPNLRVVPFAGLLVDTARELGATAILRGLRAFSDFDHEFRYALANRDLSGLETAFLLASHEHIHVSSSLVKEIAAFGGDVSRYVSPPVVAPLRAALARR